MVLYARRNSPWFLRSFAYPNLINYNFTICTFKIEKISYSALLKWSEGVAVGQDLPSISSQAGLQLQNVLVTLTLSHRSFKDDTDHGRVWITLGDWHCVLETFMLGSRSETMQSSITACSTGQSANHLHHRGDYWSDVWSVNNITPNVGNALCFPRFSTESTTSVIQHLLS